MTGPTQAAAHPFHLSLLSPDLVAQRRFYVDVLGARVTRLTDASVDLDFFGHQVTFNLARAAPPLDYGQMHFGAIVPFEVFVALRARLRDAAATFVVEPTEQAAGSPDARWKMVVRDPSGYAVELKAYSER